MTTNLFMSDLHIGSKRFHNSEGLIAILSNKYSNRFLLGDVIDTYDKPWESITHENREVIQCIDQLQCTIILGNHDPSFEIMVHIFPHCTIYKKELTLNIGGKHTILLHGDRYHMWCHVYSHIAGIFRNRTYIKDWLQNMYERYNYRQFQHNILGNSEKRTIKNLYPYYERIIMGHTHTPKIINTPHVEYINTGSWVYKSAYIEYEHEERNFKLTWV
jgi:UDP-2,3-diacylglucosamine pyrophosphatase LpxH